MEISIKNLQFDIDKNGVLSGNFGVLAKVLLGSSLDLTFNGRYYEFSDNIEIEPIGGIELF